MKSIKNKLFGGLLIAGLSLGLVPEAKAGISVNECVKDVGCFNVYIPTSSNNNYHNVNHRRNRHRARNRRRAQWIYSHYRRNHRGHDYDYWYNNRQYRHRYNGSVLILHHY